MSYSFKKQIVSFNDEQQGVNLSITIETPDLTNPPSAVTGNWGPNCLFDIDETNPLKVHYKIDDEKRVNIIDQSQLLFKSPMLAKDRKNFPFYLNFNDNKTGYDFTIFFNKDGQARKVTFDSPTMLAVDIKSILQ